MTCLYQKSNRLRRRVRSSRERSSKGLGTKECSRRRFSIQAHLSYIRTRGDACLLAQPLPFPFLVTFYKHSELYLSIMSSQGGQSSRDSAETPGPPRKDSVMGDSNVTGGGGAATSNDAQTQTSSAQTQTSSGMTLPPSLSVNDRCH